MLLKFGDPFVGRQLVVLVVAKDVDPQANPRLVLELGLERQQKLEELVLPSMADEDGGLSNLVERWGRGGTISFGGLTSEQLAVGLTAPCAAVSLRDALH